MESNNEIARVPFAVNEQDFERETDFIHTKVLALFCVVIIVAFVRIYRKHIGASNYPERQVTMRWYDDHVTTVIHQADEGFHRVPYAKLRKIRRQGHLTVIAFHDNTFLYVPRTAFSDEGQQTAFEAFLKEKCAEYSNK